MYTDDSLSAFSNSTYRELGRKTLWLFISQRMTTGISFLVIALALSVVRAQSFVPAQATGTIRLVSWVFFAGAIVSIIIAFIAGRIAYKSWGFMVSDDALRIKRGIFTRQETAIPYRQIQNIGIESTFGQRMMGVSRLVIYTATHEDDIEKEGEAEGLKDDGLLPFIDSDTAVELQSELLRRANVQRVLEVQK